MSITPLSLILLLFLAANPPTALSRTAFYTCSPTFTYPPNGKFYTNLLSLLSSLVRSAPATGFANLTEGTAAPHTVYGLALCRGDLNSSICSACLNTAASDAVAQCPGSLSGAVFYDKCRLRYSETRFFSSLTDSPVDPYYFSRQQLPDAGLFRDRFEGLAKGLQERAAFGNASAMYASGSTELVSGDRIYGMVQCSRDLSGELCARCLDVPIRQIACCESNVEMTYQGGSCYLRYAMYLFFNESVIAPPAAAVSGNATAEETGSSELNKGGKKKHLLGVIIFIVLGLALMSMLLFIAFRTSKKRKQKPSLILGKPRGLELNEGPDLKFNRRLSSKKYSFMKSPPSPDRPLAIQKLDVQTLKIATDRFSENRRLGRGEFGVVYKGDLPGQEFVVKQLTATAKVDLSVLQKEFRRFSKIQHSNIVNLLAFHMEKEGQDKLVVYEYLQNTSLDRILFDAATGKPTSQSFNKSPSIVNKFKPKSKPPRYPDADNRRRVLLDWGRRYKIIQGVAQGLLYLHGEGGSNIFHENLKASNVLLDKMMEPKLSDFCLPSLFNGNQGSDKSKKSSIVSGYMSPEYLMNGTPTAKSDVFSYGVLILEIVTGQRNRDLLGSESSTNLLSYVWQYWKEEKALQVLDWSLGELYKGHEVLRCIHVGLLCVQEDPEKRPNMSSVVQMLNSYSFILPSPSAPAVARLKKSGSGGHNGSGNPGSWDWKMYNQNPSQMSPKSPSGWSDVKLESR